MATRNVYLEESETNYNKRRVEEGNNKAREKKVNVKFVLVP
jgi:hypothetical protein